MPKIRNITVAVPDELYCQTRRLAAESNLSVTSMVRYLLYCLPKALQAAPIPAGSEAAASPISAPADLARAAARAVRLAAKNAQRKLPRTSAAPLKQPLQQPKSSALARRKIGK